MTHVRLTLVSCSAVQQPPGVLVLKPLHVIRLVDGSGGNEPSSSPIRSTSRCEGMGRSQTVVCQLHFIDRLLGTTVEWALVIVWSCPGLVHCLDRLIPATMRLERALDSDRMYYTWSTYVNSRKLVCDCNQLIRRHGQTKRSTSIQYDHVLCIIQNLPTYFPFSPLLLGSSLLRTSNKSLSSVSCRDDEIGHSIASSRP